MRPRPSATPKAVLKLGLYDAAIIVAGSRGYDNYEQFDRAMGKYMREKMAGKTVIFISGMAKTGADAMILDWAKVRGYPWAEFPAPWKEYRRLGKVKQAGYVRNAEMADYGTHLVVFYDGLSSGTAHMLEIAERKKLDIHVNLIDELESNYGWQS